MLNDEEIKRGKKNKDVYFIHTQACSYQNKKYS